MDFVIFLFEKSNSEISIDEEQVLERVQSLLSVSNERPLCGGRAPKIVDGLSGIRITFLITDKRCRRFHKLVPRVLGRNLRGTVRSPSRSCTHQREPIGYPF